MTLIALIQESASLLNLPRPTLVMGNTDQTILQLRDMANIAGRSLARTSPPFQNLIKEKTFTTVAAELQSALTTLASDFGWFLNGTLGNRTDHRAPYGPLSARERQWQATTFTPSIAGSQFYIRGGNLYLSPAPAAGQTAAFEYVSNAWVLSGSDYYSSYQADTDTCLFDDHLMVLEILWRWRKAKGLQYDEEMAEAERERSKAVARDGGRRVLDLGGKPDYLPRTVNVNEGNWTL